MDIVEEIEFNGPPGIANLFFIIFQNVLKNLKKNKKKNAYFCLLSPSWLVDADLMSPGDVPSSSKSMNTS